MSEQKIIDFCKTIMSWNNCENVANANFKRGMKAWSDKYEYIRNCIDEEINGSTELNNKDKS